MSVIRRDRGRSVTLGGGVVVVEEEEKKKEVGEEGGIGRAVPEGRIA